MSIKAIETKYNGYRFRSRLEARWAVFFDTLGIPYEYEKEGFDLDGMWYLPDFWLPEQDCWIEIKGKEPTWGELRKVAILSVHSGKRAVLLPGGNLVSEGWEYVPKGHHAITLNHWEYFVKSFGETGQQLSSPADEEWWQFTTPNQIIWGVDLDCTYTMTRPVFWHECSICHHLQLFSIISINAGCECWRKNGERYDHLSIASNRIVQAIRTARQARFEHGR